jgi:hypothetical protein
VQSLQGAQVAEFPFPISIAENLQCFLIHSDKLDSHWKREALKPALLSTHAKSSAKPLRFSSTEATTSSALQRRYDGSTCCSRP